MHKIIKLDNGIPVVMERIDSVKSVSLGVYFKTGSKNELVGESGISHLLEHMMFKGTKKRSALEISAAIDNIGGQINAYTSKEVTAYYTIMLSRNIETGIDILSDILINSTFSDENLEKEKKVIIEEIHMYEDIPEDRIHDLNSEFAINGNNSNIVLGTVDSVNSITRDQLINYYKSRYAIDNMVISIAGNYDEDKIIKLLNDHFKDFNKQISEREYDNHFSMNSGNNYIKKDSSQVHLCFNTLGCSYLSDNRYVLAIISNILGGNMSSRLFQKVREEKGLVYSIYSYQSSYSEGGMFSIYAGTKKENYKEVVDIIKDEFKSIRTEGVKPDELEKAKNQLLSGMILGLETSRAKMSRMASSYLTSGKIIKLDDIIEKVTKVAQNDIIDLATKMFDEKNYSLSVMGDI